MPQSAFLLKQTVQVDRQSSVNTSTYIYRREIHGVKKDEEEEGEMEKEKVACFQAGDDRNLAKVKYIKFQHMCLNC